MSRLGLLALLLLGVATCGVQARSLMDAQKAPDDFLRSNGNGNAYLVVNTVRFDFPPSSFNEGGFRSTVASFFKIDTSQVVINKQYGVDSGTAAEFYALFKDQGSAQTLINAFNNPETVKSIFSKSSLLNKNPRVVQQQKQVSQQGTTTTTTAQGGAGGVGAGGGGGQASGNTATPGSPGQGTPGAPGSSSSGNTATPGSPGQGTPGAPGSSGGNTFVSTPTKVVVSGGNAGGPGAGGSVVIEG